MSEKVDYVVAAVPTYNMSDCVLQIVPELLEQGYNRIFVLDDCSTDNTTRMVKQNFGSRVELVVGDKNIGSAGNRNRILPALQQAALAEDVIINFVDADTRVISNQSRMAEAAVKLFQRYPDAGMIGGQVLNSDGSWSGFNYGPASFKDWVFSSPLQLRFETLTRSNPDKAKDFHKRYATNLKDWPDPFSEPAAKEVGWLVECFTFIRASIFSELGGYDASLRYCEGLDLAARLRQHNLSSVFDPIVGVRHLQVDNRGWHRTVEVAEAALRIGLRRSLSKLKTTSSKQT